MARFGRSKRWLVSVGLSLGGLALVVPPSSANLAGSEFRVNTYLPGAQWHSATAMDDAGNFVVVWDSDNGDGFGTAIYAQRYSATGAALGQEFRINAVAGQQSWPDVAMDSDGDFIVTWASWQGDNGTDVHARRYRADGTAAGDEFLVTTTVTGDQMFPAVAADGAGNFVVAWESSDELGSFDILAQRFDAAGARLGDEFMANTLTSGNQRSATVAMGSGGIFIIAWANHADSTVVAQRYTAGGVPAGSSFVADLTPNRYSAGPDVAMTPDGDFALAWVSSGPSNASYGVVGRLYDASGVPQGTEFRSSATNAKAVQLALTDGGELLAVWFTTDAKLWGRRYDDAGAPLSKEGQINTTLTDTNGPGLAMDADGDAVVTWSSFVSGSWFDVLAQRLGRPVVAEVCDGVDNDGDGSVDEGVTTTYYRDADSDGHGSAAATTQACSAPPGYVTTGGDADDSDSTVYPGATELCDGKDNDQDGSVDEGWPDSDGDSIADCVDPDDDNDGIPDTQDPDVMAAAVAALPDSSFKSGSPQSSPQTLSATSTSSSTSPDTGLRTAFLNQLDKIEVKVADGDTTAAIRDLQTVRQRIDGCDTTTGAAPDTNDWVVTCTDQVTLQASLDDLVANLS